MSRDGVTVDGVWIGNRIYWTLTFITTNNYDSLTIVTYLTYLMLQRQFS
jgi:hypothetical protein